MVTIDCTPTLQRSGLFGPCLGTTDYCHGYGSCILEKGGLSKDIGLGGFRRCRTCVLPATVLEDYPVVAGTAKNGVRYMTADGNELPDLGTKQIPFRTREGHDCGVNWQIADIQRPLLSVTTLTAAGNQIRFDKDGGTITTKDGKKTMQFYCQNGVYVLDLWVLPF